MDSTIIPWRMDEGKVLVYRLSDKLELEVKPDASSDHEKIAKKFFDTFKIKQLTSKVPKKVKPAKQSRATVPSKPKRTDELAKVYQIPIYNELVGIITNSFANGKELCANDVTEIILKALPDDSPVTSKNKAGAYIRYLRDKNILEISRHEGLQNFYKIKAVD